MTNIGAINSKHKKLWCHKKSWIAMNICGALCHGLGYFGILLTMSWPRIFWDTFGNIMA
jgi:hypothetical protein